MFIKLNPILTPFGIAMFAFDDKTIDVIQRATIERPTLLRSFSPLLLSERSKWLEYLPTLPDERSAACIAAEDELQQVLPVRAPLRWTFTRMTEAPIPWMVNPLRAFQPFGDYAFTASIEWTYEDNDYGEQVNNDASRWSTQILYHLLKAAHG